MGDISEQAYSDKLAKVLDYTIANLEDKIRNGEASEAALSFFQTLASEAAATAVVLAAIALTPGAAPVVLIGAWLLAGYSAANFLADTVTLLLNLRDIDLCDEAALQGMGDTLANSIGDLGEELLASAVLGAVGRIGGALSDAVDYASDGAWALWRRLRERFSRTDTVAGFVHFPVARWS